MSWIDWIIVIVPLVGILGLAWYAKRYARGVVDYLAAGRVAGRYVICVGDMVAGLSVITLVAGVEQHYQTGYGVAFWNRGRRQIQDLHAQALLFLHCPARAFHFPARPKQLVCGI